MILRTASPTTGPTDPFRIPWEWFVQLVLEITIEAYQCMRRDGGIQRDWEEDTFTIRLTERYIQPLARRHPLNLIAMPRTKVHTTAMQTGNISSKKAVEIDIRLFSPWIDYNQVYFAWECKRLGDKRMDEKYAALIPEYITEGIFRFIDGEYAAGLDDAGMLGYILAGDVTNIVGDIHESMCHPRRTRLLSASNHLVLAPAVDTFNDVYQSSHKRTGSHKSIRLHHLFLTFDFER